MTVKTILRNPVVAAVMGATLVATPVGVLYMSGSTRPADAAEQSLVTQQPMAPVSSGPSAGAGPATKAVPTVNALPDFRALVQRYGSAVVNISVSGDMKPVANHSAPPGFGDDNPFFRFFGMPMAPGQTVPMQGQGSGFIVGAEGTILTNAHVVDGARKVIVKLTDHREFEARVVGVDKKSDVAMLKIDARDLPVVKLGDPNSLEVGEWVVAIGSPFGFENSVTAGIVSATGRSLPDDTYVPFIQTDVAVNPGNSGGPLFNLRGEVVGMNSQIYSRSGGYQGVSFAIPIDVAMNVGQQLQTSGHVTRGRLGVGIQDVDHALAESFGLDVPKGALVSSVDPDSPAAKAGVKEGDVVLAFNGKDVDSAGQLPALVAAATPGSKAELTIWRDQARHTLQLKVGAMSDDAVVVDNDASAPAGRLGMSVRPLSPEERREMGGEDGLLVEGVNGAAAEAGIRPGDIVLAANGQRLRAVAELQSAVSKAKKGLALLVQRGETRLFVPIELG